MAHFYRRLTLAAASLCLALVLGGCNLFPSPGTGKTPAPSPTRGATPTTVAMPPTQTSCPTARTARAAVMFLLALGSHASVVYISNKGQGSTPRPLAASLNRYDVTTRSELVIVNMPNASIDQAQISADGQWVLFSTQVSDRSAIQLVRLDGQGLQTLYCAASSEHIGALAWSPDQKYLAFQEGMSVYVLAIATGTYRLEVPPGATNYYVVRTWLDTTRLYLSGLATGTETPPLNLYLLDSTTAKIQQVLASPALCGDFDRSIDSNHLYTSECQFVMPAAEGPSSIRVQSSTGGPATTIYTTPSYAITALRAASNTVLLFLIHNTGVGSVDVSHNGLWKVNADSTGLTRLTTETADEATIFTYTRSPWSTVSRDGAYYAVRVDTYANPLSGGISPRTGSSLRFGLMNGGAPVSFATATGNVSVDIVGWTIAA